MILPLKRRESKYSPVVVSDNFSVQLNLNEGFTTTKNEQTELLLVTTERQNDVGWVRLATLEQPPEYEWGSIQVLKPTQSITHNFARIAEKFKQPFFFKLTKSSPQSGLALACDQEIWCLGRAIVQLATAKKFYSIDLCRPSSSST